MRNPLTSFGSHDRSGSWPLLQVSPTKPRKISILARSKPTANPEEPSLPLVRGALTAGRLVMVEQHAYFTGGKRVAHAAWMNLAELYRGICVSCLDGSDRISSFRASPSS